MTSSGPELCLAGERALVVRFGRGIDVETNKKVLSLLSSIDAVGLKGIVDAVPGFSSLLIRFDPLVISSAKLVETFRRLHTTQGAGTEISGRLVKIPVIYGGEGGPDLENVAKLAEMTPADVVSIHSAEMYRVYFVGFTGGFPYLGGLNPKLSKVPRLATPKPKIPAGSVALAGGQTGIYPLSTPGGWHVLGHTKVPLFDPSQDPPALLRAGDHVQFIPVAVDDATVDSGAAKMVMASVSSMNPASVVVWAKVKQPGMLLTIQDLGRQGHGRHGVSVSGTADDAAIRIGNALLGNPPGAAALEVTLGRASLIIKKDCWVVLTGANCDTTVSGSPFPPNKVQLLQKGEVLEMGKARDGARAYICVAGGVVAASVLGSRASDIKTGLGPKKLVAGQELLHYEAPAPSLRELKQDPLRLALAEMKEQGQGWTLRVMPGPGNTPKDAEAGLTEEDRKKLAASFARGTFTVDPLSDRMGVRLQWKGDSVPVTERPAGGQTLSEGIAPGSIQLPPDGNPILLLADYQSTGGYLVPAVVIAADMWKVGQLRAGDSVRLRLCDELEALSALRQLRAFENIDGTTETSAVQAGKAASKAKQVDLNADCGEGFDDAGLMQYITSANIACGGHAGDPAYTQRVVSLAAARGIVIGAHVSFEDRQGFGRVALDTPPEILRAQVLWQTGALDSLCKAVGTRVRYIKPHGALYHVTLKGGPQADAVVDAAKIMGLPLLLMPGCKHGTYTEGFAERAYDGDLLRDRKLPGAVIHDPAEAAKQGLALAEKGIQSICVHGDSPGAVQVAKVVKQGLETGGYKVVSFYQPKPISPTDLNHLLSLVSAL